MPARPDLPRLPHFAALAFRPISLSAIRISVCAPPRSRSHNTEVSARKVLLRQHLPMTSVLPNTEVSSNRPYAPPAASKPRHAPPPRSRRATACDQGRLLQRQRCLARVRRAAVANGRSSVRNNGGRDCATDVDRTQLRAASAVAGRVWACRGLPSAVARIRELRVFQCEEGDLQTRLQRRSRASACAPARYKRRPPYYESVSGGARKRLSLLELERYGETPARQNAAKRGKSGRAGKPKTSSNATR